VGLGRYNGSKQTVSTNGGFGFGLGLL